MSQFTTQSTEYPHPLGNLMQILENCKINKQHLLFKQFRDFFHSCLFLAPYKDMSSAVQNNDTETDEFVESDDEMTHENFNGKYSSFTYTLFY